MKSIGLFLGEGEVVGSVIQIRSLNLSSFNCVCVDAGCASRQTCNIIVPVHVEVYICLSCVSYTMLKPEYEGSRPQIMVFVATC